MENLRSMMLKIGRITWLRESLSKSRRVTNTKLGSCLKIMIIWRRSSELVEFDEFEKELDRVDE